VRAYQQNKLNYSHSASRKRVQIYSA